MLSVIIPVLDEAESLPQLVRELDRVAERTATSCRSIIVDDGSTDGTWPVDLPIGGRRSANSRHSLPPQFRQGGRARAPAFTPPTAIASSRSTATCRTTRPRSPPCWPSSTKASTSSAAGSASGTILAQGAAVARLQLAGQPADGRAPARSQLRPEGVSPRGDARDSAVRRAAPLRARAGRGQGLSHRRSRRQASAAKIRQIEVRRLAA